VILVVANDSNACLYLLRLSGFAAKEEASPVLADNESAFVFLKVVPVVLALSKILFKED